MGERAVYYCRVSTEEENQQTSILHQKEEAVCTIQENGWELIDGYVDEGRSGTTTRNRTEYNRMNQDMEKGRFDILVVKSQDRLMRNTREWYRLVDRLNQWKIRLYFYLERKFYMPEDALLTGIKAILAEDYSRSLSRNINNAHERRQATGSNVILTSHTWGYDKRKKQVVINEQEAEMVRLIYRLAAQGYGSHKIAQVLVQKGYQNRKGGRLAEQSIRRILRNPLYKGTALMNRQHRNFETKQIERRERSKWVYHEKAVPAIVSEELWEQANRLMNQRMVRQETTYKRIETISTGNRRHRFSGKLMCGCCGSIFWRRSHRLSNRMQHYWCCSRFLQEGKEVCNNIHLTEEDIEKICLLAWEYRQKSLYGTMSYTKERIEASERSEENCLPEKMIVYKEQIEVQLPGTDTILVKMTQESQRRRTYHIQYGNETI